MAFFPASSTYPAMLGELYSAAFNAPAFNWQCSPVHTELETIVLDWLASALHLPESFMSADEGGGVIQGSASEAIVTVMIAARERYLRHACAGLEGKTREDKMNSTKARMVALGSEQSHSSTAKAALILGITYKAIPSRLEDDLALTGEGVQAALEECKRDGLEPFYLTTTFGTTATCATDHFAAIIDVSSQVQPFPPLWVHVDAAYAGAALVCEEYAPISSQFAMADSFDMNMHKWLLTNFDASCLFIRHRSELTSALSISPSYLRNDHSDKGLVIDYRDWQIPLGRRFRSLKIWFVLRTYGINGLKAHIRKHIAMGENFAGWIRGRNDLFEITTPPAFALTVFTLTLPKQARAGLPNGTTESGVTDGIVSDKLSPDGDSKGRYDPNTLTKTVYERINASGEFFLTSSVVKGVYAIRVVSANPKASEPHLKRLFELLVRTSEEVLEEYHTMS